MNSAYRLSRNRISGLANSPGGTLPRGRRLIFEALESRRLLSSTYHEVNTLYTDPGGADNVFSGSYVAPSVRWASRSVVVDVRGQGEDLLTFGGTLGLGNGKYSANLQGGEGGSASFSFSVKPLEDVTNTPDNQYSIFGATVTITDTSKEQGKETHSDVEKFYIFRFITALEPDEAQQLGWNTIVLPEAYLGEKTSLTLNLKSDSRATPHLTVTDPGFSTNTEMNSFGISYESTIADGLTQVACNLVQAEGNIAVGRGDEANIGEIAVHAPIITRDVWLNSAAWNVKRATDPGGDHRGFDVIYETVGIEPDTVNIKYYWASGETMGDKLGDAASRGLSLMSDRGSFNEKALEWGLPPEGTTHILILAERCGELENTKNVCALRLHAPAEVLENSLDINLASGPKSSVTRVVFEPGGNQGYTMSEAEVALNVHHFNWLQRIVKQPSHWWAYLSNPTPGIFFGTKWPEPTVAPTDKDFRYWDFLQEGLPRTDPPYAVTDPRTESFNQRHHWFWSEEVSGGKWWNLGDQEADQYEFYWDERPLERNGEMEPTAQVYLNTQATRFIFSDRPYQEVDHFPNKEAVRFETILVGVDVSHKRISLPSDDQIAFVWEYRPWETEPYVLVDSPANIAPEASPDAVTVWSVPLKIQMSGDHIAGTSEPVTEIRDQVRIDVVGNDFDFDGALDPGSVTIVVPPEHGTATVELGTGRVLYEAPDSLVADRFTYRVRDMEGRWSTEASVTVSNGELIAATAQVLHGLTPSAGDLTYHVQPSRTGILTVEANTRANETAQLAFWDTDGNLLDSSPANDCPRIDWLVEAGQELYVTVSGGAGDVQLMVANQVGMDGAGTKASVFGDSDTDVFSASLASDGGFGLNGLWYNTVTFPALTNVSFLGSIGDDEIWIKGSAEPEIVSYHQGNASVTGGYVDVIVESCETFIVSGGGGKNIASLDDSSTDDLFTAAPDYAVLESGNLAIRVEDFAAVHAYARNGGSNRAVLIDSPGVDKVKIEWQKERGTAKMYGAGYYNRTKFFQTVQAEFSEGGVNDILRWWDSPDNDTFECQPGNVRSYNNSGFSAAVIGAEFATIYASNGGNNKLIIHDSPGDDVFLAKPHKVQLFDRDTGGDMYEITARKFKDVTAFADQGGARDYAKLYDTVFDDLWESKYVIGETWSAMTSNGRAVYEVSGFERVKGYSVYGGINQMKKTIRNEEVDFVLTYGVWEEVS